MAYFPLDPKIFPILWIVMESEFDLIQIACDDAVPDSDPITPLSVFLTTPESELSKISEVNLPLFWTVTPSESLISRDFKIPLFINVTPFPEIVKELSEFEPVNVTWADSGKYIFESEVIVTLKDSLLTSEKSNVLTPDVRDTGKESAEQSILMNFTAPLIGRKFMKSSTLLIVIVSKMRATLLGAVWTYLETDSSETPVNTSPSTIGFFNVNTPASSTCAIIPPILLAVPSNSPLLTQLIIYPPDPARPRIPLRLYKSLP